MTLWICDINYIQQKNININIIYKIKTIGKLLKPSVLCFLIPYWSKLFLFINQCKPDVKPKTFFLSQSKSLKNYREFQFLSLCRTELISHHFNISFQTPYKTLQLKNKCWEVSAPLPQPLHIISLLLIMLQFDRFWSDVYDLMLASIQKLAPQKAFHLHFLKKFLYYYRFFLHDYLIS